MIKKIKCSQMIKKRIKCSQMIKKDKVFTNDKKG